MKLVIFGLTVSSSWGSGHATLWRGLLRAFVARGHEVVFYERDVPYYAGHRDLRELPGGELSFYRNWNALAGVARNTEETIAALQSPPVKLADMAARARRRVLAQDSAARRAEELERLLSQPAPASPPRSQLIDA